MAGAAAGDKLFGSYKLLAVAGAFAGLVLGFTGGVGLTTIQEGRWAGSAVTWLTVAALLIMGCLVFVALS
jgi:hypothetical protein